MAAPALRTIDPHEASGYRTIDPVYREESLAQRAMRMFREEWDKPFWRDLRLNVNLDFGYYTGSGQWAPEVRSAMEDAKKPALTLNHIRPTCNVLFGLEKMNRYDPRAAPQGQEDVPVAEVFTRLMRKTQEDTNGEFVLSSGFMDGTICGVTAYELPITYMGDAETALRGRIEFHTVRVPDELMWTTPWRRYDLQDCRMMWRHKWVDVDDLAAAYPRHKEAIKEAMGVTSAIHAKDFTQERVTLSDGDPTDRYKGEAMVRGQDDRDFWFDEKNGRVRVLEVYYPAYTPMWILGSADGKRVIHFTDERRMASALRRLQARNADYKLIERNVRTIEMAVILPANETVLEEPALAYPKDPENYPYVPFFAELARDEIQGVVRSLRDPQDEINARRSQIAWLTKATGDGWFVDEGSLVDPVKFQEESRDPKGTYAVKKNASDPRRMPAPNLPQGLFEILRLAVNEIRQISGVNSDLLGDYSEGESGASGIAIKQRKQQGMVVTTSLFDNFKLTKRLVWKKMARRIQEVYTDEQIVRLLNPETAQEEFIEINKVVPEDESAEPSRSPVVRQKVLNDLSALKYDVVMVESPASPTARMAGLATLLELVQKVPAATPLLLDAIVEMTDGIPGRDRVLARIKKFVADMQAQPEGPPPPKVSISLRGELDPGMTADIADGSLDQPAGPQGMAERMGAENGNPQNPSGQLPTGGANLQNRPDLPS